jgi:hypothetical protein
LHTHTPHQYAQVYGDVVVLEARATGRWKWSRPLVVGDAPAPRTGHSAVLLQDGVSILISGGWDPDHSGGERYFEDSFGKGCCCAQWVEYVSQQVQCSAM